VCNMSLQTTTPKSKRAQRYLEKRAAKVVENPKVGMFIKGSKTSEIVTDVLNDLMSIKKPEALRYFKKKSNGGKGPFESTASFEFFSQKADASLFMFGSHSKKRPHNLVIGRLFEHHMLDMLEVGITNYKSIRSFAAEKLPLLGSKPCFCVIGPEFNTDPVYEMAASLIIDFFRGRIVDNICLAGLDHVITLSVGPSGAILFRHYGIHMKKSGSRVPKVELEEIGPSVDFVPRRNQFAEESLRKQSLQRPRELNPKKQKNTSTTNLKETVANIHLPKQNIGQIEKNAIKPKALKRPTKKRKRTEESAASDVAVSETDREPEQKKLRNE